MCTRVYYVLLCGILCGAPYTHTHWSDAIVPCCGITAATSIISYGIYQYYSWCEQRHVENVYMQFATAMDDAHTRYQPLWNIWQHRAQMPYDQFVPALLSTSNGMPFEDYIAELEATINTLDTLMHEAHSTITVTAYPHLHADVQKLQQRYQNLVPQLQQVLQFMQSHYGQLALYDTLYTSRNLAGYYGVILNYHSQYPDPDRRHYVDQALMSQYASAHISWPRLYAVDQMAQHLKAIERGYQLLEQETTEHLVEPEYTFNHRLLEYAYHLWYHLKEVHLYIANMPAYHAERNSYYQAEQEKERDRQWQQIYQQQVNAEKDRAHAERQRAESENSKYQEMRRANDLRNKAIRWGIEQLPHIQHELRQIIIECESGDISREETCAYLRQLLNAFPESRSSIEQGLALLCQEIG